MREGATTSATVATTTGSVFAGIDLMARDHFRVSFHAAAYRLVNHVRRSSPQGPGGLDRTFARYPFLEQYFRAMAPFLPEDLGWDEVVGWWEGEIGRWEASAEAAADRLPILSLSRAGVLDFEARMALLTTGLVEEDPRFGSVFQDLQHPVAGRRPNLDTIAAMASPGTADPWSVSRSLLAGGLVEVTNPEAPRSEWVLRVAPDLWEVLRGQVSPALAPWCRHVPPGDLPSFDDLILSAPLLTTLRELPGLLGSGEATAIVVRGMAGSDRQRVAGAVAAAMGRGTLVVEADRVQGEEGWRRVGPLATALGALPVLVYELPPGEAGDVPPLVGYTGPLVAVLGLEGGLRGEPVARSVTLEIPSPPAEERRRHWRLALDGHTLLDEDTVSERFHLPPAHIRQTASVAAAIAALDGREVVTVEDVRVASRTLNRQLLDTLAVRLEPGGGWEHLVVTHAAAAKLLELERRCRHRERVLARLGPAFHPATNRGVRALFTGASGTGKTLAAKILAAELDMDVYRVDLAAIVNKYVGETEKNLHRVLSTAEELDVVLLVDEGDALLGSRTEVRSANDRFANLETNYLLQRLETYQGIVVVTTNAGDHIDPAFQRRMDVVVNFVEPGPSERWRIWEMHLPADHDVPSGLLEELAARCVMTGGQIRNAAMRATLLALDNGDVVGPRHVEGAVAAEYGKAGALSPLDPARAEVFGGGVQGFLEAMS